MTTDSTRSSATQQIDRIAHDAHGRYQAGFSLREAIEAACCGYIMDPLALEVIEGCVLAQICRTAGDLDGALCAVAPAIKAVRDAALTAVLERARAGCLYRQEAGILAAAVHHDPLWEIVREASDAGRGATIRPVGDPLASHLAIQQTRLAAQIARAPLDDRISALVLARAGDLDSLQVKALAAATRCKEIWDSLASVRQVIVMTRAIGQAGAQ